MISYLTWLFLRFVRIHARALETSCICAPVNLITMRMQHKEWVCSKAPMVELPGHFLPVPVRIHFALVSFAIFKEMFISEQETGSIVLQTAEAIGLILHHPV